jgi:hypothetical protein
VPRAQFTSEVVDREPTNQVFQADKDCGQITLFAELRGMAGSSVDFIWVSSGEVVHVSNFEIGSDRWRVWSTKEVRQAENLRVLIYSDGLLVSVQNLIIR